jgi:FAD/FMN-containing dehydrogenase
MRRAFTSLYACPRNPKYATLNPSNLKFFESLLQPTQIQTDDLDGYNTDWIGTYKGNSSLVLKPNSTEEVRQILMYCNANSIAICPQSGKTGLVGGSVPVHDEVILSLAKMNKILELDERTGIIRSESGVILQTLNEFAMSKGFVVPLDLGAKGSCFIGGNIATNAGGIRYLRYGSLHGSVLGLEVVLPSGEVMDTSFAMRKDNTGFDLKQLFIGSEGSLGIITKVSMLLAPKPTSVKLAFLRCDSFDKVIEVFARAKTALGEILSAYEFMDSSSMEMVLQHLPAARFPLGEKGPFYILIETSGSNDEHDEAKFNSFLEEIVGEVADDGVLAQDLTQYDLIWSLRESCAVSAAAAGYVRTTQCFKYDVSLPLSHYYELVRAVDKRLGTLALTNGYGHIGDSNLHLNVVVKDPSKVNQVKDLIDPFIYEYLRDVKGSISAEHGVGLMKREKLHYSKDATSIKYIVSARQKAIKQLFDPNGILNPYKVVPAS